MVQESLTVNEGQQGQSAIRPEAGPESWSELLRAVGAATSADEPRADIALFSGLSEADIGWVRYCVNNDHHGRIAEVVRPPRPRGSAATSRGPQQHPGSGIREVGELADRWETMTNPAPPEEDSFDCDDDGGGGGE